MNTNTTNADPFTRFDDLMAERGLTDRLEAYEFVDHFRWFHRSEHDCPKAMWMSGWKQSGRYGTFAYGQHFNMTTVYNYCLDHDEPTFKFLGWLDAAANAMDECSELCEQAYIDEQLEKCRNRA